MPIQKLDDHVINQIAAGEVVERPASVVKELIENSIDAGADFIEIELIDGGKEMIKITDNGRGIAPADFPLVFERHATSKIANLEDLQQVLTLGFRGEALASIGSVAKVTLQSRAIDQDRGQRLVKIEQQLTDPEPVAMNQGTIVTVEGLFKSVPARQKYLKTANTEYRHIAEVVIAHAAANPNIHFRVINDGKTKIDYPQAEELLTRALQILAVNDQDLLVPISYQSQDLAIKGWLGKPQLAQKSRKKQYIAVNERPLQIPFAGHAVKQALHTLIPHNLQPIFVLNVMIDPTAVDVNVHPRKLEARFSYQQFVYQKLRQAVKASLEKHVLTAKLEFGSDKTYKQSPQQPLQQLKRPLNSEPRTNQPRPGRSQLNFDRQRPPQHRQPSVNQALAFNENFSKQKIPTASIQPIAQLDEAYLVGVDQEGLVVIDQHAAHERVMYGRLQQARERYQHGRSSQPLLTALTIDLDAAEQEVLQEYLEAVQAVGFDFKFTDAGCQLVAVPTVMPKDDLAEVVKGLVVDLQETNQSEVQLNDLEERIERVINYTACRSAIKFGQSLTIEEQNVLIAELDQIERNYTCPHGRPTRIRMTFKDLEKQFGR